MTILSAEEFARLRTSEIQAEYQRAAQEEAPEAVWLDVIERFPELRSWVAYNKTIPVPVLERLAGDPDPAVRWMVALKRKAPPAVLERLAQDPDESVRLRVAHNPKTPPEVLELLVDDPWNVVRDAARARCER